MDTIIGAALSIVSQLIALRLQSSAASAARQQALRDAMAQAQAAHDEFVKEETNVKNP